MKSLVKWVGGKSSLLPQLIPYFPKNPTLLIDAFCGGGSVSLYFLKTYPGVPLIMNDMNGALIWLWKNTRDNLPSLEKELRDLETNYNGTKSFYESIRSSYNSRASNSDVKVSAQFYFLNKTCFNGLYRENRAGNFNTSWGNRSSFHPDYNEIKNISLLLNSSPIQFMCGDYSNVGSYVIPGSFVYLDPPYRELTGKKSFNSYLCSSFSDTEQIRLKNFCDTLPSCLISNSYDPNDDFLIKLYSGYNNAQISAPRRVSGLSSGRGNVMENIFWK